MSINIAGDVCKAADSIMVTVRTGNLGPRQRSTMKRAVLTGVVKGRGLPSRLALSILKDHGMPYVHVHGGGRVAWEVSKDEDHFFLMLGAVKGAIALAGGEDTDYTSELFNAANDKRTSFGRWVGRSTPLQLLSKVKFKRAMPKDFEIPEVFTYNALAGERL